MSDFYFTMQYLVHDLIHDYVQVLLYEDQNKIFNNSLIKPHWPPNQGTLDWWLWMYSKLQMTLLSNIRQDHISNIDHHSTFDMEFFFRINTKTCSANASYLQWEWFDEFRVISKSKTQLHYKSSKNLPEITTFIYFL